MASYSDDTPRNVVPNWRDYHLTAQLGEMSGARVKTTETLPVFPIDEYVEGWRQYGTPAYAGELLSAAMLNRQAQHPEVLRAARFIVTHPDEATPVMVRAAESLLKPARPTVNAGTGETIQEKVLHIRDQEAHSKTRIRQLRRYASYYGYNPIAYCEMSRCYTSLGLLDKAKTMMDIAVRYAPNHRYVSRSAARLYIHLRDFERARYVIAHNEFLLADPWLLASEIAINNAMNRTSRHIKRGKEVILSQRYHPFCVSELSSAIATIEMQSGSRKKCQDLFNMALRSPNDNSLAQAQWLKTENKDLYLPILSENQIPNAFEARFWEAFDQNDYVGSIHTAVDWLTDMPFSHRAVFAASDIAYIYLKDYQLGIDLLEIGHSYNPEDAAIMNNLAYACALNNDTERADIYIQKARKEEGSDTNDICLIATEGLNEYRKGNVERGRQLYLDAIYKTREKGNTHLNWRATLNFVREEVIANPQFDKALLSEIASIPDENKEITQLKKDIEDEIQKHQMGVSYSVVTELDTAK